MIPIWVIPLLNTNVGEFLYDGRYRVYIRGVLLNDGWVVDVHVVAFPYFSWGCNKKHTGMKGSFKSVVRYYLAVVLNQLAERGAYRKNEILSALKDNLE